MIRYLNDPDSTIITGTASRHRATRRFTCFNKYIVDFLQRHHDDVQTTPTPVQPTPVTVIAAGTVARARAHGAAQIAFLATDFNVTVFIAPLGNFTNQYLASGTNSVELASMPPPYERTQSTQPVTPCKCPDKNSCFHAHSAQQVFYLNATIAEAAVSG